MPLKTPVKKSTKKSAHKTKGSKPVKKTVKRITQADIEANFARMQKSQDEAWAAIRETQKNVGGLSNSLDSIVERILTPGLPEEFKKFGYSFNRISSYSYAAGVYTEVDGMLENGAQAVVVEVKYTPKLTDIDNLILRMEKIRKHAYEHGDKRQFMGAMAAIIPDEATKKYALKKGLFVIEPSGEDVKVTKPEAEPRIW